METVKLITTDEDGTINMLPDHLMLYSHRSSIYGLPIENNAIIVAYRSYPLLFDLYPPIVVAHTLRFLFDLLLDAIPPGVYLKHVDVKSIVVYNYTPLFVPGSICFDLEKKDNAAFLRESVRASSESLAACGGEEIANGFAQFVNSYVATLTDMRSRLEFIARVKQYNPTCYDEETEEVHVSDIPPLLFYNKVIV
jgi:hypothetical protein